jgi:hypothetical protein
MTTPHAESEDNVRIRQTLVLRTLALRLANGDPMLPADVMGRLTEELEYRVDEEAVTKAWAEQASRNPNPWRGERARESRRSRGVMCGRSGSWLELSGTWKRAMRKPEKTFRWRSMRSHSIHCREELRHYIGEKMIIWGCTLAIVACSTKCNRTSSPLSP